MSLDELRKRKELKDVDKKAQEQAAKTAAEKKAALAISEEEYKRIRESKAKNSGLIPPMTIAHTNVQGFRDAVKKLTE